MSDSHGASPAWGGHERVLSATEMAAAMVRELIEAGELLPGQRLNADELGERLGVSRTPIRDALHRLRTEGLVEIKPRKGVFVRTISVQEIEEVYTIKAAVEPIAAAWAASRGEGPARDKLRGSMDALKDAAGANDIPAAARSVGSIHRLIFEMAQSSVLLDVYKVFDARVRLLRQLNMAQPGRLETSVRQHEEIVDLVNSGDPDKAAEAMARHMTDASSSVMRLVHDEKSERDSG